MRIGVKPGQWGWGFEELVASWQAAEEAGFDIVSCFDHVSASPSGLAAWDAPTLVCAMAGITTRIALAVDVLNSSLRHPFLLAGQLAVAQAASGGRLEVGLGAGSHHLARFDHQALGLPFPPLKARRLRLAGCCRTLRMLWRGEGVTDPLLGLNHAALGPLRIDVPPIFVGGASEETMAIAAEHADGWNAVVDTVERFRNLSERVDGVCARVGRERPLQKAAQVFVRDVPLAHAAEFVEGLAGAGAEAVTFVLVAERGPDAVRDLARAVLG